MLTNANTMPERADEGTQAGAGLPCLSVRQPWAWLIVHGWKNVENRPRATSVRGRILIHASATMTKGDYQACWLFVSGFAPKLAQQIPRAADLPRGGIVGEAVLLDCVRAHASEWFCGPVGYVLAGAKPLPFAPCKGKLGFFSATPTTACGDGPEIGRPGEGSPTTTGGGADANA